ncbi:MAG: UDP-N-acetylmuramoyl-tripeptide--D-alanyl-D-alanine ligase [Heliobacteriaceae bacterium]|nr:UDP-N-acetylmuramoyl-tripeptide--D-alanyl-D-alanine ligase [Heliobacteriaceae bacterium]MDD4588081.1 UDP-N-acetylmuramoyl-tripeptide--D-alanyl-D-alanine ligase [Heliobacteriaceae bacterium]
MRGVDVAGLAGWAGGKVFGDATTAIDGVARVDSRLVTAGDVFFALPGEKADGHLFVAQALAAGAVCAVVRQIEAAWLPLLGPGKAILEVADGLQALQACARAYRETLKLPVIAVTGSTGKTSTKDLLAAALGTQFKVWNNPGNFNNEIGLPLTVLGVQAHHQALVVEMGMRGPGQIRALCAIARPQIGVLTNIGPVHLELLGSLAAIAQAKGELLGALPPDGTAVVNGQVPAVVAQALLCRRPAVYYGLSLEELMQGLIAGGMAGGHLVTAVIADKVELLPEGQGSSVQGRVVVLAGPEGPVDTIENFAFFLPLPGRHQAGNALAALAVTYVLGGNLAQAAQGLGQARLSALRWETHRLPGGITLINDAYNANPAAMEAALTTLAGLAGLHRKVAVLGEMYELGFLAVDSHEQVGKQVAESGYDLLVAIGNLAAHCVDGALKAGMNRENIMWTPDVETAVKVLPGLLRPGDYILVKASRGMHLERLVMALKD